MVDLAAALNAAGVWLASDPQRARREMADALLHGPDLAAGWFNYGLALHLCGRAEQAIRAYRHGLLCPDSPQRQIANNLSQDLLLTGRFAEGWQVYEHRPRSPCQWPVTSGMAPAGVAPGRCLPLCCW